MPRNSRMAARGNTTRMDVWYATEGILCIYAVEGMYCIYAFNGIYYTHGLLIADPDTTREAPAIPAKRASSHPSAAWTARRLGPNSNRKNRSRSAACQRWTVIQDPKCPRGPSSIQDAKLAMATRGKSRHHRLREIHPR